MRVAIQGHRRRFYIRTTGGSAAPAGHLNAQPLWSMDDGRVTRMPEK